MDKYEYKIRSEEIKSLIAKGEYAEAASLADTIDWSRVRSVMMLCTISDLYKINRRFEDARDMLLMAYDKYQGGRSIVYSLCELSIKMGEFVQAVEYYKEFVQIAPKDSGRYVLQYKLYEAQEVSLEERIAVLEELKSKDYNEKWAYELAYLYHRIGLATKCVEECDELILWFGEGKYVLKAMELKMLHEALNEKQQAKYQEIKGIGQPQNNVPISTMTTAQEDSVQPAVEQDLYDAPTKEIPQQELDIQVKLMNVGQYDTINIQKELAENMKDLWEGAVSEETPQEEIITQEVMEEVFFGETGELDHTATQVMEEMKKEAEGTANELTATPAGDMKEWSIGEPPQQFRQILGMEYDGQISMVMPESEQIEKQITGQISLQDVLAEWERMKKDSEQKRMEAVRQRVMEQTGAMFTEFDAATRDGLLEHLEEGIEEPEENSEEEEFEEIEEIEETEQIEGPDETDEIEESEETAETDFEEEFEDLEKPEEQEEPEIIEEVKEQEEPEIIEEVKEQEEPEIIEEAEEQEEPEIIEEAEEQAVIKKKLTSKFVKQDKVQMRALTEDEKRLYGSFALNQNTRNQIINAIDNISLASYTGNVIITGDEEATTLSLAQRLLKEVQISDDNFSGKIAKISPIGLRKRSVEEIIEKLDNGALIIQKAGSLDGEIIEQIKNALEQENRGLIVILTDSRQAIHKLIRRFEALQECFTIEINIDALQDGVLVSYAQKYAKEQEYSIDEMGILALHTRIAERQTSDHSVTITEVREMIDEAIRHANKKTLGHFFDILVAKRYDEEDMIILREKDFS